MLQMRNHRGATSSRMRLLVAAVTLASSGMSAWAQLPPPPPLPVFPSTAYNVAVANLNINGGVPANTGSSNNAAAIQAYIDYASGHGGGHVEIPAGSFLSGTLTLKSNVDLQLDSGAILRGTSINNKLITASSGSNMQISGSGIIDGGATTTAGGTNLVDIRGVNTLAILGVQIQNAGHEHLVPINDNNVTISGITISDPGTLAANGGRYLANTDAIDYAGNNFLIKNCNISCGDDDIVAKPASNAVSNVVITNCTIGAGHGISVGGGVAQGVTNMLVSKITMNGTDNGLRVKAADKPMTAGDAGGGLLHPLKNVTFKDITMTNVTNPIVIDSFYDNGNNNFPTSPTSSSSYSYGLPTPVGVDGTTPIWQNIAFENITVTGSSNAGLIYGLNTSPSNLNGVTFSNVNISASKHMDLWYGTNIDLSGLSIAVPPSDPYATAGPVKGAFLYNLTNVTLTPKLVPGDFGRDGQLTIADISAMLVALTDLSGYQSSHALTDVQMEVIGDLDGSGAVTNADVNALIGLLRTGGGSLTPVPEPASIAQLAFALLGLAVAVVGRRGC